MVFDRFFSLMLFMTLQVFFLSANAITCADIVGRFPRQIYEPEISRVYEKDITEVLLTEPLSEKRLLRRGAAETYVAEVKKYGLKVIIKSYNPFWGEDLQSLRNEAVAWVISRSLKMDIFPFGVLRRIDGRTSWVQLFVPFTVGVDQPLPERVYEILNEKPSSIRSELLTYLLGDEDFTANGLIDKTKMRRYYIDAGASFQATVDPKNVHPFSPYGDPFSSKHIKNDPEFYKSLVRTDPNKIVEELKPLVADHNHLTDFILKLRKVQSQIKNLLALE